MENDYTEQLKKANEDYHKSIDIMKDLLFNFKPSYKYNNPPNAELKEYDSGSYTVLAPINSCFFCKKCIDIFYDYTCGPYMFICDDNKSTKDGLFGKCSSFDEE